MTEPHFTNDMTFSSISKQKASIPDPGLVSSAFADYVQDCQIQLQARRLENYHLQNQVNELEECLADAKNKIECMTRSLAYANTEIRHLRCSQHPESLNGESYEDWENRRYPDE